MYITMLLTSFNNSHQNVEFVISIITNLILSCWYDDGFDWNM